MNVDWFGGQARGAVDIGQIAVCCALEYLDFRFGSEDWRKSWANLVAWQKKSLPVRR